MTIEGIFLASAADKLAEDMDRIQTCLSELPSHALWARDAEHENAVGNLLLHLDGNVRQWMLAGVGEAPDDRDRPSEFSARGGPEAATLLARLSRTVQEAMALIQTLPHRRLVEPVHIQGYDTTVLGAIFHVVEHFTGHTYQIILLTKRWTGKDLGFYRKLDETGRRESERRD